MRSFLANPPHSSARSSRLAPLAIILLTLTALACGTDTPVGPAPKISSTTPLDAAANVALNIMPTATFDRAMAPLTATNFTLKHSATAVAGAVSTSADGLTATFTPATALAAGTAFTATIVAGATSTTGAALAADHAWTFTTATTANATPPVVSATNPVKDATGVAINTKVAASFSKAMDASTISSTTFTLKQGSTAVPGNVSYGPGTTATFTPTSALSSSVVYTASLSTGVKDLVGNALASAFSWNFTTGNTAAKGPAPVLLGTAGNYVVLAKAAISSVPTVPVTATITGDIAVSPAAESFITGFGLTDATGYATSPQVVGKVYAADQADPTPINLTTAVGNMEAAYTDAAGRTTPDFNELLTGHIGGQTLAPGLYKWTSSVDILTDVTISGGPNDTWIFQTTGDLTQADNMKVILAGGALAKNIWWQVAGKASVGAGAHFEGVLLCKTDVTLVTGASMNGRLLSQTAVALQKATVVQPAP